MDSNNKEKHEEENEESKKEIKVRTTNWTKFEPNRSIQVEGMEGSYDEEQCMWEIVKKT